MIEVNSNDGERFFPLFVATQNQDVKVCKLLVHYDAFLDKKNGEKDTCLLLACQNGHFQIVKLLIENQVNINLATPEGMSPLFLASQSNNFKICRVLGKLFFFVLIDFCKTIIFLFLKIIVQMAPS